jgi:hypothetical protein
LIFASNVRPRHNDIIGLLRQRDGRDRVRIERIRAPLRFARIGSTIAVGVAIGRQTRRAESHFPRIRQSIAIQVLSAGIVSPVNGGRLAASSGFDEFAVPTNR